MAAPFFFVPTEGSFWAGADNRLEKNRTRRLANVEAMRKLGEDAALAGKAIGVDDWAEQAKNILGFDDFLNSTSPSADVMETLRQSQNAKAQQKEEELNRARFKAELEESNSIEAEVAKQAAAGKSEGEITQWGIETFGDKFSRVVPRLPDMINRASVNATKSGYDMASMFDVTDAAEDYIKQNPSLTKWEQEGIRNRAKRNEMELMQKIATAGEKVGATLGYTDDASVRSYLDQMVPESVQGPKREQAIARGVEAAKRAQQAAMAGAQQKIVLATQEVDARTQMEREKMLIDMEQAEQTRREQAKQAMQANAAGVLAGNAEIIKQYSDPKKVPAEDKEIAGQFVSYLQGNVVQNPAELLSALREKDQKKVNAIMATAVPIAAYQARVDTLSGIVTGARPLRSAAEGYDVITELALQRKAELADAGASYAENIRFAEQAPGGTASGRFVRGQTVARGGAQSGTSMGTNGDTDPRARARYTADTVLRKTGEEIGGIIKQTRSALVQSNRLAMTPEEMRQQDIRMAEKLAATVADAANLPKAQRDELWRTLVVLSMQDAGEQFQISPTEPPSERLRRTQQQLMRSRGQLPGAQVPTYPMGPQGPNPAFPPANF